MIGPVSSTGRAMMASLQQAIQKGMPPDQAIQYVKGMATQGVAPLADLYSMMNQFQRLKQQQVQPPQTPPTIRDQLNMMDQMQQQQMQPAAPPADPMARGLGAIDAGRMEYPQFAGGGIVAFQEGSRDPVSSVGGRVPYEFNDELEAQIPSFMTGDMDIVSFVKAQMPNFDSLPMNQKQAVLKSFEPKYMQARAARQKLESRKTPRVATEATANAPVDIRSIATPLSAESPFATSDEVLQRELAQRVTRPSETSKPEVAPEAGREAAATTRRPAAPAKDQFADYRYERPDLAAIRTEREERQQREKTGAYSQADADLAAYIKEQKEQYGASEKEARNNFWIQTGASLMASKSPYFMQALGESIKENYGGLVKDLKKLKDDTGALRLQEIQLRRAQEQAMESGTKEDQQRYDALQQRYDTRQYDIFKTQLDIEQKALNRDHEKALVQLRQYGNDKAITQLNKMYSEAMEIEDQREREAALEKYRAYREEVRQNTIASTAGGVSAEIRADVAGQARLANLAKNDPMYRNAQRKLENPDSYSPEEVRQAQEIVRIKEQQALGTMPAGPRVTPSQSQVGAGYTGLPTTSGW